MREFDFSTEIEETQWLVESLIPMGHLCLMLAQAGVGKSLVVESLAVHIASGVPFCGLKSLEGDVLILDQDTPQNVLQKRLIRFNHGLNNTTNSNQPKHKLFWESMRNYSLDNGTLITAINDYPSAILVIIDSLHSFCGRLNPNTSDMAILAKVKSKCLTKDKTILFNHHISQKKDASIEELMSGETNSLAMGYSGIMQQTDSYYIVGATAVDGRTDRIYVRPVSKRVSIARHPFILRLTQPSDQAEVISYESTYEPDLSESELDIMTLFREQTIERTVQETYDAMGHKFSIIVTRKALAHLEKEGKLLISRHKSNLFKYRLP